jgi:hypothetical protein
MVIIWSLYNVNGVESALRDENEDEELEGSDVLPIGPQVHAEYPLTKMMSTPNILSINHRFDVTLA